MSNPLPALPRDPLGTPPAPPALPRDPLGTPPAPPVIGRRTPLPFPTGGRARGGSTRAPLPSAGELARRLNRPAQSAPPAPDRASVRARVAQASRQSAVTVTPAPLVSVTPPERRSARQRPASAPPAPTPGSYPGRTASGRVSAEARREAIDNLLGRDTGRFIRGLHSDNQALFGTLMREHGIDERMALHRSTAEELRGRIAEVRANRANRAQFEQAVAQRQRANVRAAGAALRRSDQEPPAPPPSAPSVPSAPSGDNGDSGGTA